MIANVRGRRAVVVGAGAVAERKVGALLAAGADVRVIAPGACDGLRRLAGERRIAWEPRPYRDGDLEGALLAFAATDRDDVNRAVGDEARRRGVWLNDAADARRGDFATPAVVRRGPLTVTVDTGGHAPAFAKGLRDELAAVIDERYPQGIAAAGPRPNDRELVCATRASALAMVQTRAVLAKLAEAGIAARFETVSTKGDRVQDRSLAAIGGDGVFVKELESALLEGRADFAVHSCKDLPSTLDPRMTIAAVTRRADPRDVFCSERYPAFADLPAGARVGTSSPRRRAQMRALRPDLRYDEIRGNVDSRLRKLHESEYDAIVLAAAGLERLGATAPFAVPFAVDELVPAVAQGALAVETRAGDPIAERLRAILEDAPTAKAVAAERAFLRTLRGGCQAPVGAHAAVEDGILHLRGAIVSSDGATVVRGERRAEAADASACEAIGMGLATELLERGGEALVRGAECGPLAGRLVVLPRTQDRPSRIAPLLRDAGAEVIEAHDSPTAEAHLAGRVPDAILFPSSGSVAAIGAYLASLRERAVRPVVAAMGASSSEAARASGFPPDVVAERAEIETVVESLTRYVTEHPSR